MSALGRIRSYELKRAIARGGMATVFLAVDLRSGREVALKQILPQVANDQEFLDRFRHEVQIHAALHHPNILEVYELEAGPEHYFIAMELAGGGTLRGLLERSFMTVLPEVALHIAAQMLRGLECAHASGIVHRDIKPHNVLLTQAGDLKVADFGISKTDQMTRLTQTGDLVGTPAYMSPEQASMAKLDARTDVFSVGVVLYEMLAGVNPFNTGNPVTTLRMITDHHPEPLFEVDPRIPVACELLVEQMLAKDRERRYPGAGAAAAATEGLLAQLGVTDPKALFLRFLHDPQGLATEVRTRQSAAHLRMARSLAASGQASPEVLLWEAFQATVLDPENAEAASLAREEAARTGYSLELGVPPAKAEELQRRLEVDPANVSLLLQLAKLHKMQKSLPRLMRCFFRLRSMRITDPYVQGQVAMLVARPGARPAGAEGTATPRPAQPHAAPAPGGPATPARPASPEATARLPAAEQAQTQPYEAADRGPLPPRQPAPRPAPAVPRGKAASPHAVAATPARAPTQGGIWGDLPWTFKLGFALAALLVLTGLLKLILGS